LFELDPASVKVIDCSLGHVHFDGGSVEAGAVASDREVLQDVVFGLQFLLGFSYALFDGF
jgi:hypothetical protein